jgi:hypothetical protein
MGGVCGSHGGDEGCIQQFGWPERRRPLGRPRSRWEDITLRWILGKQVLWMWIGFIWLRIGIRAGSCEHGVKPSGSVKCGEFPD